jgi:hypothetical protein
VIAGGCVVHRDLAEIHLELGEFVLDVGVGGVVRAEAAPIVGHHLRDWSIDQLPVEP